MAELTGDLKKTADGFLADVREAFGDELSSVIVYGAAARNEKSKQPYINFLVAVGDNTPSELAHCSKYMKQWNKKLIAVPLFITPGYIEKSLDTFPLEFMDMATSYFVVYGEDMLQGLEYRSRDVRNACEREIKGKLLHLRAEYLYLRGNAKGLIDLVNRSLATFRMLFAGALYLRKRETPGTTEAIIDAVTEEYGLDIKLFQKLFAVGKGEIKIDDTEADELFDKYVEEIDKLSLEIDFMYASE